MSAVYVRARSGVNVLITPSTTVRDDGISYRAAGVLSRLLDNAEGYSMTAEQLAAGKSREGRDAVRTALRELEAAGYILRRANKQPDGSFKGWTMYVHDTPAAATGKPENPLADFPFAEKPVHKSSKSIKKSKSIKSSSSSTRARDAAAGAAAGSQKPEAKARRERASGIVCYLADDPAAAARIEGSAQPAELRAAVATAIAAGKEPVPGRVAKEIQRASTARAAAERAAARAEAGPLAEARRRAEEGARRDADPAQRAVAAAAIKELSARLGVRPTSSSGRA